MNNIYFKSIKKSKEYQFFKKNLSLFKKNSTIISGMMPKQLGMINFFKKSIILVQYYNIYEIISDTIKKKIIFDYFHNYDTLNKYKQLIFFWMKDKREVKFQMMYILSYISYTCNIYVIGKKNSGINSISNIFYKNIKFKKINYARNCCLYQGYIIKKPIFLIKNFIKTYIWKNLIIDNLPGVFGYNKIDNGSKLLISTFSKNIKGKILDVGCGTGILSIALAKKNPSVHLNLVDINNSAIWCSKHNLLKNQIVGKVFFSNIYSNIKKKYDLIISNPPIHKDKNININMLIEIIKNAKKYLKKNGELRFIVNTFISCNFIFKKYFLKYKILLETKNYKIFQIKML